MYCSAQSIRCLAIRRLVFGASALLAMASPAFAESLSALRAQEAEETALAKEAQYTSSLCRMPLATSIDWRTVANWPDNVRLSQTCDGALGAIEWVCKTPQGRNRAKRITRFVCAGDGSGPSLKDGTLRYGASPDGNGFAETKAYLEGNL